MLLTAHVHWTRVSSSVQMEAAVDLDNTIADILIDCEQRNKRTILHAVSFY